MEPCLHTTSVTLHLKWNILNYKYQGIAVTIMFCNNKGTCAVVIMGYIIVLLMNKLMMSYDYNYI